MKWKGELKACIRTGPCVGPAGQSHVCRTYNTVAPGVCGELHELAVGDRSMDPLPITMTVICPTTGRRPQPAAAALALRWRAGSWWTCPGNMHASCPVARAIASCYFASGGSGKCEHRTNTKATAHHACFCISSLFPAYCVVTGANHGLVYDDSVKKNSEHVLYMGIYDLLYFTKETGFIIQTSCGLGRLHQYS